MVPRALRVLTHSRKKRVACQSAGGANPVRQYNVPARFRQSIRPRGRVVTFQHDQYFYRLHT